MCSQRSIASRIVITAIGFGFVGMMHPHAGLSLDDKKRKGKSNLFIGGNPVVREVKPVSGRVGEKIRIEGANFVGGDLIVTFNGVRAPLREVEADELRVFVPAGATSGPLLVSVGGKESNTVHFVVEGTRTIPPVTTATASQPLTTKPDSTSKTLPSPSALVSLSKNVQPIFDSNCTSCHGGTAGLTLDKGESYANLVNVDAQKSCAREKRVVPGNSSASVLYKKISGTSCGTQMPKKAPPLSDDEILLIRDWIDQGAANN